MKPNTSIANEIYKNTDNNNGVFVLPNIIYNTPLTFPISTEFHRAGQVVFQKSNAKKETNKSELTIEAAKKITFNKNVLNNIETFREPSPPNDTLILLIKICVRK